MSSVWEAVPEDSPSTASTAASESSEISEAVGPPGYRLSVAQGVGRSWVRNGVEVHVCGFNVICRYGPGKLTLEPQNEGLRDDTSFRDGG